MGDFYGFPPIMRVCFLVGGSSADGNQGRDAFHTSVILCGAGDGAGVGMVCGVEGKLLPEEDVTLDGAAV